jgi:hypothetical protein
VSHHQEKKKKAKKRTAMMIGMMQKGVMKSNTNREMQ